MVSNSAGVLYVIATPIGNMEDLTPRAKRLLGEVALVAAEDTRRTGRLLASIGVEARLLSLHEHNETRRVPAVMAALAAGDCVALVSDAGTPLVSDPGYRLLSAARDAGCVVVPVPGACAAVAALSVAGLPSDRFVFEGFLPDKAGARRARLEAVARETATLVFYVSVHKIEQTLDDMACVLGANRAATLARELTKIYETIWHGTLADLRARVEAAGALKGEIVLIVAGAQRETATTTLPDLDTLLGTLLAELPAARAARVAARLTGEPRNALYRRAIALGSSSGS